MVAGARRARKGAEGERRLRDGNRFVSTYLSLYLLQLTDLFRGPLISPHAKERVSRLIASAEQEGGKILLDGRGVKVPDYPAGNFVGPTVLEASTNMQCYTYDVLCTLYLLY